MKKIVLSVMIIVVMAALTACGGKEKTGADQTLLIGTTGGPYVYLLKKAIIPGLEEKGYNVGIAAEYKDEKELNDVLSNNEINVNLFQHGAFLQSFTEEHKVELSELIKVPTEPTGIYSTIYSSLDEIEEGVTITIPNDQVNIATALAMLQKVGLIKLDPSIEASKVTEANIVENPKNLYIQPILVNQTPISIHSAELAVVPGNFALNADMEYKDALALEEVPQEFQNIIAIKTDKMDQQFAKDIIEIVESEKFKEVMETNIYHVVKEK